MSDASVAAPSGARAWFLAIRPKTLTAAAAPVLVGSACAFAAGAFEALPAAAALLGAFFLQIGSNFANDVYDYEKGADDDARLGPARAVQSGWITPAAMKRAMVVVFALATLVGVYLVSVAGWPIVAIGLASIAAAIAYTGGPYPLGYNGLGDLFVLIFFGYVAVCGTAFVLTGGVPATAWWCATAVGLLAANILVVNNTRDEAGDRRAGKRTLVVRFGRGAARAQYIGSALFAVATPVILWALYGFAPTVLIACAAAAPLGAVTRKYLRATSGPAYNAALGATAGVLFVYSLALAASVALAAP